MKFFIYWLPRILAIVFMCFLTLFSFDVFSMEASFYEKIGGFLIHNVPVFILLFLLLFTWRNEKKGGILFLFLGVIFTIFFKTYQEVTTFFLISFPLVLIGLLFLWQDYQKKKGT
jgi:hypothetical protein